VPRRQIVLAENGSVVELTPDGARIVDEVEAGVDVRRRPRVGDISDVALRDRRHLSEDGVLIIVATLAPERHVRLAARADRARLRRATSRCSRRCATRRGGHRGAPVAAT
jgi:ribonuclease J